MVALALIVANLERQCALYAELEGVLVEQQSALAARAVDRLDAVNGREALLVDALAAAEAERQGLMVSVPEPGHSLRGLAGLAAEPALKRRLDLLAASMPPLVQRVLHLVRTNRVLASDADASCGYLLRLLGFEDATGYAPPAHGWRAPGHCLRLDVTA